MTIGQRIKNKRCELGWSRRTVAQLTGYTEQAVYCWETGKYSPSKKAIRVLEKAFGGKLHEEER